MPFLNSVRAIHGAQRFTGESSTNGLTVATAFTTKTQIQSAPSSGLYYIKTSGMSAARQMYIDANNTGGPSGVKWVRIFLPVNVVGYSFNNQNEDVDAWLNSDVPALIESMSYFMYSFVNMSNNSRSQSWYFGKPTSNVSDFKNFPPTVHGGDGSPLITQINAIRMSTQENYTSYLRTGSSSFGSQCDDGRSSRWGQICLKAGNTSATGSGGYSDFPHYATYSVTTTTPQDYNTHCSSSNENYSTYNCSSSKNFAVYVG